MDSAPKTTFIYRTRRAFRPSAIQPKGCPLGDLLDSRWSPGHEAEATRVKHLPVVLGSTGAASVDANSQVQDLSVLNQLGQSQMQGQGGRQEVALCCIWNSI